MGVGARVALRRGARRHGAGRPSPWVRASPHSETGRPPHSETGRSPTLSQGVLRPGSGCPPPMGLNASVMGGAVLALYVSCSEYVFGIFLMYLVVNNYVVSLFEPSWYVVIVRVCVGYYVFSCVYFSPM